MNASDLMALVNQGRSERKVTPSEALTQKILIGILQELQAIRLATEQANEPGPEDEPSPFQSLSG